MAARSIAKAFDKLKLPYDRTEKSKEPSFTKNFLQNHPHELPKAIAEARELNKAHSTFIDSITKHEHNGRIHADINQIRSDQAAQLLVDLVCLIQTYNKYLQDILNLVL